MGQADRELGQRAPQLALFGHPGLPYALEHVVGGERESGVEEALRFGHRLLGREDEIIGQPFDTHHAPRERPPVLVPRAIVACPSRGVALPFRHTPR